MNKANKIVRVIRIDNTNERKENRHYRIYLTTFQDFKAENLYVVYGKSIKLFPYAWYELQWLWTYPSFWLLSSLETRFTIALKRNNIITIATNSIIFIIESLSSWGIVEIFKNMFNINS